MRLAPRFPPLMPAGFTPSILCPKAGANQKQAIRRTLLERCPLTARAAGCLQLLLIYLLRVNRQRPQGEVLPTLLCFCTVVRICWKLPGEKEEEEVVVVKEEAQVQKAEEKEEAEEEEKEEEEERGKPYTSYHAAQRTHSIARERIL